MSAIPSSGSKADVNAALKQQINEIILIETPRHLVDKEEDLDRLFPRCPPNTLESIAKVNKKSKKKNLNTVSTSHINNNICQQEAAAKEIQNQPLQVGKIIDLAFNSNNDAKVNEQNRRYHQQLSTLGNGAGVLSPTTSGSTKSTPAKKSTDMSTTCSSSSSSSSSTKGSSPDGNDTSGKIHSANFTRTGNGNRSTSRNLTSERESIMASAIPSVTLRDTKIEIAGGREVYHQSRVKSGRHRQGSKLRHSGSDFIPQTMSMIQVSGSPEEAVGAKRKSSGCHYETHFSEQGHKIHDTTSTSSAPRPFIKETVFSSEIHSIEYQGPRTSPGRRNLVYETDLVGDDSEIVFDDIGEALTDTGTDGYCDVNVTYDLLQGEFPPPNLCGLSVKLEDDEEQDLLTSHKQLDGSNISMRQSLDNLCLGAEANSTSESIQPISLVGSDPSPMINSRIIGGITIAEYDGSPRRYRPRGSNETTSNASSSSDVSRTSARSSGVKCNSNSSRQHGMKLPGFPQRILPSASEQPSSSSSSPGMTKKPTTQLQETNVVEEEELLKFDDIPNSAPLAASQIMMPKQNDFFSSNPRPKMTDFDLRFEFSETRKVLEEFFPPISKTALNSMHEEDPLARAGSKDFNELEYTLRRRSPVSNEQVGSSYIGQRLATDEGPEALTSPCSNHSDLIGELSNQDLLSMCTMGDMLTIDKGFTGLTTMVGQTRLNVEPATVCHDVEEDQRLQPLAGLQSSSSNHVAVNDFTLSPEMTDCDSADLESEMSLNEGSYHSSGPKMHTSMPVLEDGLSSGHASDLEDDVIYSSSGSVMLKKQQQPPVSATSSAATANIQSLLYGSQKRGGSHVALEDLGTPSRNGKVSSRVASHETPATATSQPQQISSSSRRSQHFHKAQHQAQSSTHFAAESLPITEISENVDPASVSAALKDIKMAIQATRVLNQQPSSKISVQPPPTSAIRSSQPTMATVTSSSSMPFQHPADDPWVRQTISLRAPMTTTLPTTTTSSCKIDLTSSLTNPPILAVATQQTMNDQVRVGHTLDEDDDEDLEDGDEDNDIGEDDDESESDLGEERVPTPKTSKDAEDDLDTDQETDRLLGQQYNDDNGYFDAKVWNRPYSCRSLPIPKDPKNQLSNQIMPKVNQQLHNSNEYDISQSDQADYLDILEGDVNCPACLLQNEVAKKKGTKTKEAVTDPKVLIEGVLFRARYLGSTQLVCEGQPTKATRMMQAEEAVSRIKALTPEGDSQPSTEVDLFISTEKIMVLNTDLKEIMMDHALRTISYIADIGDLLVIMARRRPAPTDDVQVIGTTPKMICHVFESDEAQFIAQSIGQAFQVAYVEFLKANGIEDSSFVKEMDYQEVLNSQEIFNNELALFSSKERQKEVVVPKAKGEILGVVIVESGWGSMLPTIVLANLAPGGPAARCGQLNIGDQVIAINGISLVGLPLSTCQHYIKNAKNKTAVKLTAVSCAPVVEVKIKRPDTKYQLGFSVQNGVICSLLRGGIAERGGVRVGHRIIEINGQSVVAVPHEKIVNLLATSVGEITMKTMPTSMFRLLTGQESPLYI